MFFLWKVKLNNLIDYTFFAYNYGSTAKLHNKGFAETPYVLSSKYEDLTNLTNLAFVEKETQHFYKSLPHNDKVLTDEIY